MKLAVLYARYSTENQNDRSIDDQLVLCKDYARRNGYEVVGRYSDAARTGGSLLNRDGLIELLAAAARRDFDAIIVEALDRLSRDMEAPSRSALRSPALWRRRRSYRRRLGRRCP